jgi:predicted DNA-binding transcriptional regulator AlpA
MTSDALQARAQRQAAKLQFNKIAAENFPQVGNVRANQCAAYLGIGLSTFWLYVEQGRIKAPTKYGVRLSVWDAVYIHQLRDSGIPPVPKKAEGEAA